MFLVIASCSCFIDTMLSLNHPRIIIIFLKFSCFVFLHVACLFIFLVFFFFALCLLYSNVWWSLLYCSYLRVDRASALLESSTCMGGLDLEDYCSGHFLSFPLAWIALGLLSLTTQVLQRRMTLPVSRLEGISPAANLLGVQGRKVSFCYQLLLISLYVTIPKAWLLTFGHGRRRRSDLVVQIFRCNECPQFLSLTSLCLPLLLLPSPLLLLLGVFTSSPCIFSLKISLLLC